MNYKQINDYELIYMVRENDDGSKDLLYEKYLPIIKNIANEYYQKFNSYGYDYEDFVQEAMIAFQKSIISYDEKKNILFYTFTIICIRRNLLTFCRNITSKRKNTSNNNFLPIEDYCVVDSKANINSLISDLELEELIHQLIISLPFENSCIFELKVNGFTYREIGLLIDLPSSTVEFKNRLSKRRLKKLLEKYYSEKTV